MPDFPDDYIQDEIGRGVKPEITVPIQTVIGSFDPLVFAALELARGVKPLLVVPFSPDIDAAVTEAQAAAASAQADRIAAETAADLATTNGAAQVALATTQANLATSNGAAQVALAEDQAEIAVAAAASIVPNPVNNTLRLVRREVLPTVNTNSRAVLQTGGTYNYTTGLNAYWDRTLTAAEIAAGAVWIDFAELTGALATATVSERNGGGEVVAAAAIPLVAGRRQRYWTVNASTTILRITVTASSTGSFEAPAVGYGKPSSVPTDPYYTAAMFDNIEATDSEIIAAISGPLTSPVGADGTIVDDLTFIAPAGTTNYAFFRLTQDVALTATLTVLIELTSATNGPRAVTVTPISVKGAVGTAIPATRRYRNSKTLIVQLPAEYSTGVPVGGVRVEANAASGGTNIATSEQVTVKARVYSSIALPHLRFVPAVIGTEIADRIAAATVAQEAVIEATIQNRFAEFLNSTALTGVISGMIEQYSAIDIFVDPVLGNDGDAGTYAAPKATVTAALAIVETTGGTIGLKRSVPDDPATHHFIGDTIKTFGYTASLTTASPDVNLVAYGFGTERAVLDVRQNLSGLTWTLVSGKSLTWETVATHRMATDDNDGTPIDADSTHYRLWLENTALEWKYNEASLAAMETAVEGDPGSWGVNIVGQTTPDPRDGTVNGTQHRYIVHLPDGSDPNGKAVFIADRKTVADFYGGTHKDIATLGAHGKDNCHSNGAKYGVTGHFATFDSVEFREIPGHGMVGPVDEYRGVISAYGRAPEGSGENKGMGGALHLYTGTAYPGHIVRIGANARLNFLNVSKGLYCHGTASIQCYEALEMHPTARIDFENVNQVVASDANSGTASYATATLYNIYGTGCDAFWQMDGTVTTLQNFDCTFTSPVLAARMVLAGFKNAVGSLTMLDGTFRYTQDETVSSKPNFLAQVTTAHASTLTMVRCVDETEINAVRFRGAIYNNTQEQNLTLNVTDNSVIGDIKGSQSTAPTIAAFVVDGTSEAGLNNSDQATIEGLDVDYDMQAGARLVSLSGRLIEVAV
ncbi:MAG: hypothetical protein WC889_02845 [Myxococcota bacterium]|jgi:hypothetical protein